jgi:DNA-binding transcriptional LysR family regulator
MELRQLRQFLALVQAGNFHRAAAALNMAQPPLSVSIRKLEEELGMRLFERHSRGVTLTPEGETTAVQAREILRRADELKSFATEVVDGSRGVLNIGFVASATYGAIPSVIPVFRQRFPAVDLRLKEATTLDIVKSLRQGDLDVGLVRTPVSGTESLTITPLLMENLVLAVPHGHRLQSRSEVELEQLRDEPLILYDRTAVPSMRNLIDLSFSTIGITPNVVEEAAHIHTMMALVDCGLGAALLPAILRRAGTGRVRLVDLVCRGAAIQTGLALAVREGETRRLVKNFSAVATEVLSAPAPDEGPSFHDAPSLRDGFG